MRGQHPGTFTVACSTTKNCGGRRRGVVNGVLVCISCDEAGTLTYPNTLQIESVPGSSSQWRVRGV